MTGPGAASGDELYLPGLADPDAAEAVRRHGHSPEAAAVQAEAVFGRLQAMLADAGAVPGDVCKITMQITDETMQDRGR